MKMKKILFDCDNTMGVPDCDVDDGLALLYLLGCPDAEVCGITTTYGNNRVEVVLPRTRQMLKDIHREDIPLKEGGHAPGAYDSEASRFLAETAASRPGEYSVLATGSLTNLYGAYRIDPHFFEHVKEIVLMGGITQPLVFEKKMMNELNFSCDPEASAAVLIHGRNVSVMTGNNCLKALFTKEEYRERLFGSDRSIARYIREETDYYFKYNETDYGIQGFYNWDVTAAASLMHPELFTAHPTELLITAENLKTGFLNPQENGNCTINLPEIGGVWSFKENIYNTWMQVEL